MQPSTDHHDAYRDYAMTVNNVPAWRDALEQAALLEDSVKINEDFSDLLKALKSRAISVEDEFEVVLPELRSIDNAPALQRDSDFQAWFDDVTHRYNVKKEIAA